ncbi:hypothetical protein E2C01_003091 [Portunus trituberculatus]|uniref:Uncharacterized protein n=1 Tax=Portunus trituberculatus TaxID=210409 RepID=A0A5B7CMS1_PORTR|nr:hypothetical protein [Portunus trituberculatus]
MKIVIKDNKRCNIPAVRKRLKTGKKVRYSCLLRILSEQLQAVSSVHAKEYTESLVHAMADLRGELIAHSLHHAQLTQPFVTCTQNGYLLMKDIFYKGPFPLRLPV